MSLIIASLTGLFILTCFASTKKLVAILTPAALFYIHLPVAIGLTLAMATIFIYA